MSANQPNITFGDACKCGAVTRHTRGVSRNLITSEIVHHTGCTYYAVTPSAPTEQDRALLWDWITDTDETYPAAPKRVFPERLCEQRCGETATVYAMDPQPGGWGGYYCKPCAEALRYRITDRL